MISLYFQAISLSQKREGAPSLTELACFYSENFTSNVSVKLKRCSIGRILLRTISVRDFQVYNLQ